MADDRLFDLLNDSVDAILAATDVDGVLDAFMRNLRRELSIWAGWIATITPEASIQVVAVNAAVGTTFDVGFSVPFGITEEAMKYFAAVGTGRVVVHRHTDRTLGTLDDIMLEEGARCGAFLPLLRDRHLAGLIALASAVEGGIQTVHRPFFEGVCRGTEAHILDLIATSGVVDG